MKEKLLDKEKEYKIIMKKGKQNLRLSLILFVFIVILIFIVQGYFLFKLYETDYALVMLHYGLRTALIIFIWYIAISRLWKYHKSGRVLFFIAFALSAYSLKDLYTFYEEQGTVFLESMYFYGFLALGIIRRAYSMRNAFKYFTDKYIRSIWSVYDMFDDELSGLDEYEEIEEKEELVIQDTPLMAKAKKHLRAKARMMASFLYCFCILVLIIVVLLRTQLPDAETDLELIQYYLFMGSLYSMFIWSIPIVILYLYKRFSKLSLLCAGALELLHMILSIGNYIKVCNSSSMYTGLKWMFFIFEFSRILLILYFALRVFKDPYIYAFWKNEEREQKVKEVKKKITSKTRK